MKKITLIILISLFMVVGCSKKEAKDNSLASLTKEEQAQAWHGERTAYLGNYDFTDIQSEEEAMKLLTGKFNVSTGPFYEESNQVLEKTFKEKLGLDERIDYSLFVTENNISFKKVFSFSKNGVEKINAVIDLSYLFNAEKKQIRLDSQTLLILNQSDDAKLLLDQVSRLSKEMADVITIKGIEKGLKQYNKTYSDAKGNIGEKTLPIIENGEDAYKRKALLKSIQVSFDVNSVLREFYVNISDKTE